MNPEPDPAPPPHGEDGLGRVPVIPLPEAVEKDAVLRGIATAVR